MIHRTIREIQGIYDCFEQQSDKVSTELAVLRALAREIKTLVPVDFRTRLRKELQQAVAEERYE
ncbi:MAG TPA: hypothetical protein ENH84_02605, partial [Phycisphaerae bacterium]|nr:hypothetical protein [Phycisphaerae bacterium]